MTDIAINPRLTCKYCPPDKSKVIYDSATGSVICYACATVLEDHCFDEGREWRTFASENVDSQANGRERADISSTVDQVTGEGGGTAIVGAGSNAQRLQMKLRNAQNANKPELSIEQKEDKSIQHHTQKAREVAERLNLGEDIVNRCTILLQDLAKKKPLNGGYKVPWYCALVQIACDEDPEAKKTVHDFAVAIGHQIVKKVETPPLKPGEKGMFTATFNQAAIVKELIDDISLSSNTCRRARDAPQLVIGKTKAFLTTGEQAKDLLIKSEGGDITKEMLEEYFRQQLEEIHHKKCVAAISLHYDHLCYALDRASPIYFETEDLYKSYVQSLGLTEEVVKPAKHIAKEAVKQGLVKTSKDLNERLVVTAAMASAIFVVAWLLDVEKKPRLADVAKAAKVTEGYTKMTYSILRMQFISKGNSELLPKDYRKEFARLRKLPEVEHASRKRPAEFSAGM